MDPVIEEFETQEHFPWEVEKAVMDKFEKAMTAGSGTDAASFTGGRATIFEELDKRLVDVTLAESRARLWQVLPKIPIRALYDFYNEMSDYGGEWDVGQTETAAPTVSDTTLARLYAEVRHYRDTRQVSDILQRANTTIDPMKVEEASGTRKIIHAVDRDLFAGDADVFKNTVGGTSTRMTGIYPQVLSRYPANVQNFLGQVLTTKTFINRAAAQINNLGGLLTDCFTNPLIHSDLEDLFSTAERFMSPMVVNLPSRDAFPVGVTAGIAINRVNTGFGPIALHTDPNCRIGAAYTGAVKGTSSRPAAADSVAGVAGSSGGLIPAGDYYYQVSMLNEYGESLAVDSAQVTVGAGETVTLTITHTAAPTASGIRIYRSAIDAADNTDCRQLFDIARTAGNTTVWEDDGTHVPGTGRIFFLTQLQEQASVLIARYTPLIKKNFAQTDWSVPFGLNMSQACRVQAPKFIWIVDNVVSQQDADGGWDPLGYVATPPS